LVKQHLLPPRGRELFEVTVMKMTYILILLSIQLYPYNCTVS